MKKTNIQTYILVIVILGLLQNTSALELPLRGDSGEIILGLGTIVDGTYSPDGKTIATCGSLGVFIWDVETTQPIRWFHCNKKFITDVAYSPDGKYLLTQNQRDYRVMLWDSQSGNLIRIFSASANVQTIAFSADGTKVLTASDDRTARIWDISDLSATSNVSDFALYH